MATGIVTKMISQYGVETQLVTDRLGELQTGEQVEYTELNKLSGVDVLRHRNVISSARRSLLKDKNMVFESVRGVGLRRLSADEISHVGLATVKKIGKQARRGLKVLSAGDYNSMSDDGKLKQAVGMTVLNFIQHSTTKGTQLKIEKALPQNAKVLPLADTIAHLSK